MMSSSLSSSSVSPMSMSTSMDGPWPVGLGFLSCGRSICFCPPLSSVILPALRPAWDRHHGDLHRALPRLVHDLLPVVALLDGRGLQLVVVDELPEFVEVVHAVLLL